MNSRLPAAPLLIAAVLVIALPPFALAQNVDGYVSVMVDLFPDVEFDLDDTSTVTELRARLLLERRFEINDRIRLTAAGFVDGLVGDRGDGLESAAIVRPREVHLEAGWDKADLRVGLSRVVWGRLDEILPTDVVNPLDLARFFFEGRSEGRIPVAMVRGRVLPSDRLSIEGIYVPFFTRGRFDELGEDSSPFNVMPRSTCALGTMPPCIDLEVPSHEPPTASGQGGARASVTTGRVDWAMSAYRGFESLAVYEVETSTSPDALPLIHERFPRFTMLGADFETVRGEWGIRGEVAAFIDRTLQAIDRPLLAEGRSVEFGVGVDRKTGAYRVSGSIVATRRWVTDDSQFAPRIDRDDLLVVAAVDRSFARETRTLRVFGVYNPDEASAFARVISTWSVRDNVAIEASAGLFTGNGTDAFSRLASRDFVYGRLKVFF